MSRLEWFIHDTLFFITGSKAYMKGEKVTLFSATRAYIRFMRLTAKDRKYNV